jgi:hypothetical protein
MSSTNIPGKDHPPQSRPTQVPVARRVRVEQARDLAIEMFRKCGHMFRDAFQEAEHFRLKWRYPDFDQLDQSRALKMIDLGNSLRESTKQLQPWIERAEILIEFFTLDYDGISEGPYKVGRIVGPNVHATALRLSRYFHNFFLNQWPKFDGIGASGYGDLSSEELTSLVRSWPIDLSFRRGAEQLLDAIGSEYEKDVEIWVARTEMEAGKVLTTFSGTSSHEHEIVEALERAGKRIDQEALLDAVGHPGDGSWKKLIGNLVARGGIVNHTGNGYGLSFWKF